MPGCPTGRSCPASASLLGAAFALLNYAFDEINRPSLRLRNWRRGRRRGAQAATVVPARPPNAGNILEYGTSPSPTPPSRGRWWRSTTSPSSWAREFLGVVGESTCAQVDARLRVARLLGAPLAGRSRTAGALQGRDMVTLADRVASHPLARLLGRDAERDERAQPGADGRRADARRLPGALDDVKRQIEHRSKEVLRLVSVDPVHLQSYPHQLSGGMRRRAMIAMALLFTPEPSSWTTDLGPRRRRPALADGADQGCKAARLRGHLRHARHVARAPLLRPAAGDVRGPGGGARAHPPAVRQAPAPVHAGAAGGVPVDPRSEGAPARDPGLAAGPAAAAFRLPLRAALPAGV